MTPPRRIQRSRAQGWRMPPGTVYVGRPTAWGNPFRVGEPRSWDHDDGLVATADEAVDRYQRITLPHLCVIPLIGRDLACWCAPGRPCHADLLLAAAAAWHDRLAAPR